jgi:hypothetical protein
MSLERVLIACCSSFETAGLEYALAGGFAYGIHVEPRATMDVDFCMNGSTPGDSARTALSTVFNSVILHAMPLKLGNVRLYRYIATDNGMEYIVDIIEPEDGEYARNVLARKITIGFKGRAIPVISLEDLYVLKKTSNRLRDAADCEVIENSFPDLPQSDYVRDWIAALTPGSR